MDYHSLNCIDGDRKIQSLSFSDSLMGIASDIFLQKRDQWHLGFDTPAPLGTIEPSEVMGAVAGVDFACDFPAPLSLFSRFVAQLSPAYGRGPYPSSFNAYHSRDSLMQSFEYTATGLSLLSSVKRVPSSYKNQWPY